MEETIEQAHENEYVETLLVGNVICQRSMLNTTARAAAENGRSINQSKYGG